MARIKIFICYRRDDSRTATWHIFRRLESDFPNGQVFIDVEKIPLGEDFRRFLDKEIRGSDLVLVVIGPGWLKDPRLTAVGDFVRTEIEIALQLDIPLIPLLLDGVSMPTEREIPESIKPFASRQAAKVQASGPYFDSDMDRLICHIKKRFVPEPAMEPERPSAAGDQPGRQPPSDRSGTRRLTLRMPVIPRVKWRYVLAASGAVALLLSGFFFAPDLMARLNHERALRLTVQASAAFSRGDDAAMKIALEQAKVLDPNVADQFNRDRAAAVGYIAQAHAALDRGDEAAVAQALRLAGQLIPDLVPQFNRERAERAAGQIDQARAALKRGDEAGVDQALKLAGVLAPDLVVRFNRERAADYLQQARALLESGDRAAAAQRIKQAAGLAPDLVAQFNRGVADAAAADITQARAALDRGDEAAVAEALKRAGKRDPDLVVQFNRERAERAADQIAQARAALGRGDDAGVNQALALARVLAPDLVTQFNRERAVGAIDQARAAFARDDEDAATQFLEQAKDLAPELVDQVKRDRAAAAAFVKRAWAAFNDPQGADKAAASRALKQAADLAPDLVVKYSREYANVFRDLAAEAAAQGKSTQVAVAEAQWWEAKANEQIARQTKGK